MKLIDTALERTRTLLLTLGLMLIAGMVTYVSIPKEADPDIDIPVLYVSVSYEGISPEDSERLLVRPLEQALRGIEGVKEMRANAYEGGANVVLEFDVGVNIDDALQDVRAQVDIAKGKMPQEADDPQVFEVKLSKEDPMLVVNISGPLPERALVAIARDLRDRIEGISGVLEVDTYGDREEVLEIIVDPLAMESYGFSQQELFSLVTRNNRLVTAGTLQGDEGSFQIKVPGVFESLDDVLNMPVKVVDGVVVRLRDVAEPRRTFRDATSFARIDGHPAIGLEISKRTGANIIETVAEVKALLDAAQAYWPEGVSYTISRDKSQDIDNMLRDLQNNVLSAVLLVVIVIIGILGVRGALLVAVAIPGSFLTGILVLGSFGLTINIVVLFSLIMAVGMLVDGAIVVTELADRRMAEDMPPREAYASASKRMAWPIISSTLTTLAAFFPLVFWPGIVGEFMKYLPITLIATLSASLVMALIFVPALGAIFGRAGAETAEARAQLSLAETGDLGEMRGITADYLRALEVALNRPWWSVAAVTALLILIYAAYGAAGHGVEFFPNVEPEFASVQVRARGDFSVQEKDAMVRQVEARILGMPELASVYTRVGGGDGDEIGQLQLQFVDWELRRPAAEILDEIRTRTGDIVGLHVETREPQAGPGQGKPIQLDISARDTQVLDATVDQISAVLAAIPGVRDVQDDRAVPGIEWRVRVDRQQAARFGADVTLVGNAIQLVTQGLKLDEYRPDDADDEIDIRVRYPESARRLDMLDRIRVQTTGGSVPISSFVVREPAQKVGTIRRTDLRRAVRIEADVAPDTLPSEALLMLRDQLSAAGLDPSVSILFKGEDEDQQEAQAFLSKAFGVALLIIAIILVTQFNSFYQAFLILTAVVFSTGGVMLGHLIMAKPFGIVMSGIGVIALAGIVVNNNIVLIDTYNLLRKAGMGSLEAVLRTSAQRFRPVMLTTITTILGLMPMVLGLNIDLINRHFSIGGPSTQWWTQLASAVAGGLAFATVLTLLLTPALLYVQGRREDARRIADGGEVRGADAAALAKLSHS